MDYLSWDYSESESKFHAVGVDYTVNEDSIFFSNGISYGVISVALENDGWRICEDVQIAEPKALLEKGYKFSAEYDSTIYQILRYYYDDNINFNGHIKFFYK